MKKVFFLIIGFLFVSGLKTYSYDFMYNDIYYNIINGSEVAVTSGDSKYTGDVTIPQQVFNKEKAYSVTSIGSSAFMDCIGLTSITIPNSVTSIDPGAFWSCSGLTSITIPNSVTSIESAAFNNCSGLTSITIPHSVTTIGYGAFMNCGGLISINVESGNTKFDSREGCNAIIETESNTLIIGCKNSIIPNSVTSIGNSAFAGCSGLNSIPIPNSVTSIEKNAFERCSGLYSITIPNSVTSIGNYAFYGCSGLSSVISEIVEPFDINENTFSDYSKPTLIVPSGTKSAYQSTAGWKRFTKIEEASSTNGEWKEVTKNFDKTIAFTKIRVKNTKTSHGTYCCAFFSTKPNDNSTADTKYNINFNRLTIGDGVEQDDSRGYIYINTCKSVGDNWYEYEFKQPVYFSHYQDNAPINQLMAFVNNGSETLSTKRTIHVATAGSLPDLISESEKYTIEELTLTGELNGTDFRLLRDMAGNNYLGEETQGKLSKLDISEAKIVTGGDKYLDTKSISYSGSILNGSFVFSVNNNDVIPRYVFCQCKINSIRIPNSILSIEEYAFWGCRFLSSITIPNSVASIDSYAFDYCSGLTSITIPNSVTSIGSYAFNECRSLISITIPNSLTSIDSYTFGHCSGLASVTIPNSVTSIGSSAFSGCSGLASVTIPHSVTTIGYGAFSDCNGLTSINVESGNTKYDSRNGCNAIIETESNTLILGCKNSMIPNSVTSIGSYAFRGCSGLTSLAIPNSVTSIGSVAFYKCSGLTSITIPNSVTSIGRSAFYNCSGLTSITIPNSVTSIEDITFSGCSGLTSITIPNSVTSIGDYAFSGCSGLSSVISEIIEPFDINENTFSDYLKPTLTVPNGTKSAYQSTAGWNKFTNIVEASTQYKSLDDYIATSSVTSSQDGKSYIISPTISFVKKIYVDLRKSTTNGSYCFLGIYNEKETKSIDISSRGLQSSTGHSISVNNTYTSIKKMADNSTYSWLYYNPDNSNEVIIDVEQYFGEKGHINGWQYNFGTSCVVNIITDNYDNQFGDVADIVDLGLSVKWASWNIGASKIADYGGLYGAGDPTGLRTSTDPDDYYFKDGESICGTEYDLAHVKWGSSWRMPTFEELKELRDLCVWSAGELDGVKGNWVKGPNGNYIFLPWAGNRKGSSTFSGEGVYGYYWSGDMGVSQHNYGYKDLDIKSGGVYQTDGAENYWGQSIRPVYADNSGITVTMKAYTREYGDDNPTFEYTVSGGTLNGTPKITCSATRTSPVGTYTIKIEKGSVTNSNVTFVDNTLTITKAPLTITAKSYVKKQGEANPTFEAEYSGFKNGETASVLTKKPTFSTSATTNSPVGTYDITVSGAEAQNYIISYVKGTLTVTKQEDVTFAIQGITYLGSNATGTAEVHSVKTDITEVEIPSSVVNDGKTYQVTTIANGVLSNRTFNYVSLPSTVTSVSSSLFSNSILGALVWNADVTLSQNVFSNMGMSTKSNFLLYVNSKSYAPSNVSNVVVDGSASSITLTDATNTIFYCPAEFTAQTITYTHNYKMKTGGGKGWETIALPFEVQKIEHNTKGILTPFANYNNANTQRPFWLYELGNNGFKKTSVINANTPYIISMPNSTNYDDEYNMNGNVTFSASNAKVAVTSSLVTSASNGKTFMPAFAVINKASSVFAMNATNSLVTYSGSYDQGSLFISNLRNVYPFEAYMVSSSAGSRSISIEFDDGTTGVDEIPLVSNNEGRVKVYSISGQKVIDTRMADFEAYWQQLPSGIYIVNGKKKAKIVGEK